MTYCATASKLESKHLPPMLSDLYRNLYKWANTGIGALQLFSAPAQAANLAEVVREDEIRHPTITMAQHQSSSLERFLNVNYKIENKPGGFEIKGHMENTATIYHYHQRMKGGKSEKEIYIESTLHHYTAKEPNGRKLLIILDYGQDDSLQYIVILPEGEGVARVIDPDRKFNRDHFVEKIRIHTQQRDKPH